MTAGGEEPPEVDAGRVAHVVAKVDEILGGEIAGGTGGKWTTAQPGAGGVEARHSELQPAHGARQGRPPRVVQMQRRLGGLQQTGAGLAFWHWGDTGVFKNFVVGYPESGLGVIVMTNGANGSTIYAEIVRACIGGRHPAFDCVQSKAIQW